MGRDVDSRGLNHTVDLICKTMMTAIAVVILGVLILLGISSFERAKAATPGNACETSLPSLEVVDAVAFMEGFRSQIELDSSGDMVIGYGHSFGLWPREDDFIGDVTQEQARVQLFGDMLTAIRAVCRHVTLPVTQDQLDALGSFVMNVGEGAFAQSTLLKVLNAGDLAYVPRELTRWVHDKRGHVLLGLARRRTWEAALFTGVHTSAPPLW